MKKLKYAIFLSVLAAFLISYSIFNFYIKCKELEFQVKKNYIKTQSQLTTERISNKYNELVNYLEKKAFVLYKLGKKNATEDTITLILKNSYKSFFDYIGVVDINGIGIDSQEREVNIKERNYFQRSLRGEIVITEIINSIITRGRRVQIISVPIRSKDKKDVIGVLYGVLEEKTFFTAISDKVPPENYIRLIDSVGNYISYSFDEVKKIEASNNIWKDLPKLKFLKGSEEEIRKNVSQGKNGYFFYEGDRKKLVYYEPIGINGMYIFYVIYNDYLNNIKNDILKISFKFSLFMILGITTAFIAFILYRNEKVKELNRSYEKIKNQQKILKIALSHSKIVVFHYDIKSQTINVENTLYYSGNMNKFLIDEFIEKFICEDSQENFRNLLVKIQRSEIAEETLKIKNGSTFEWVQIDMKNMYDRKNNISDTIGIVSDIGKLKEKDRLLKQVLEIQQFTTQKYYFNIKVDLKSGKIVRINDSEKLENIDYMNYIRIHILSKVIENFFELQRIFSLKNIRENYSEGRKMPDTIFAIKKLKKVIWLSAKFSFKKEDDKDFAIIFLEEKSKEIQLSERAEKDSLTKLYNRATIVEKIEDILKNKETISSKYIFGILDLDNFKQINDRFGHNYGDEVLIETAKILKNNSILRGFWGRLGGDEFIFFFFKSKNINLDRFFSLLVKKLNREYEKFGEKIKVSASIGVTENFEGDTFEDLYIRADKMLYEVKFSDKNNYKFY